MEPHISKFPLYYILNVYEEEVKLIIGCFQKFVRIFISLYDIFIPSEIIHLIILLYIKIKIYPPNYSIYCGADDSIILYNGIIYTSGVKNCGQGLTYDNLGWKIRTFTEMSPSHSININKNEKIISASIGLSHCAFINHKGDLYMSGSNKNGQLGLSHGKDHSIINFTIPTKIMDINNVIIASCGKFHTLILTNIGLFGTGGNFYGQLGLPYIDDRYSFTLVSLSNVITIQCKENHSIVLTKEGLFGCGGNRFCQLGIDIIHEESLAIRSNINEESLAIRSFTKININNVISFSTGNDHSIVLTKEGLFITGKIGNTGSKPNPNPYFHSEYVYEFTKFSNRKDIISFSCGNEFSMVLTKNGLYGSGENHYGGLGLGWSDRDFKEISVYDKSILGFCKIDINDVISVSCGYYHTIIETNDGLYGCGLCTKNQLGFDGDAQYYDMTPDFLKIPFKINNIY